MANNRIFYACQAVAISPEGSDADFVEVHGLQSVGVNTTFNLEQVFELGQIEIYENIEGVPDVEVTLEKVLDGYPLLYRLATAPMTYDGSKDGSSLVGRTKNKCSVALAIYPDDKNSVTGVPPVQVYMSGMYLNNVSYTLPTDGNCTESVTLVGNHKQWYFNNGTYFKTTNAAKFRRNTNPDFPVNLENANKKDGVQRRENVLMDKCAIPGAIIKAYTGASTTGVGNNWDLSTKSPKAHIQSITISTDLGREDILELGRKMPYYRAPNYPVEVTSEFEVLSVSGDLINALEDGDPALWTVSVAADVPHPSGNNTSEEMIYIELLDGTAFYLGTKNRLNSINYGGADAGGGNASMTFSYTGYNELTVRPPGSTADIKSASFTMAKPAKEPPGAS